MNPLCLRHEPFRLPVLPIAQDHRYYPVRQVDCTGLSYAAHALELGRDPFQRPSLAARIPLFSSCNTLGEPDLLMTRSPAGLRSAQLGAGIDAGIKHGRVVSIQIQGHESPFEHTFNQES